jgi:hypothetical protein
MVSGRVSCTGMLGELHHRDPNSTYRRRGLDPSALRSGFPEPFAEPGRDRVQGEEIEMGLMILSCLALIRVRFSTVLRALALTCNLTSEARLRGPSNIQ